MRVDFLKIVRVCVYANVRERKRERDREKERKGMYICMYVCMYACMFAFMYVCACVYVSKHAPCKRTHML